MVYDDLPKELQNLLSVDKVAIPAIVRHIIGDGWEQMDSGERRQAYAAVRRQKDPTRRTLEAVLRATKTLLNERDIETIEL